MLENGKDVDHRVNEEILWTANPFPENFELQYFFTNFSLQLNNCPDHLREKLAPTDTRLRPDQRALEEGDLDLAATEKDRLEVKQRELRKWREENPGNDYVPHYFSKTWDEDSQEEIYKYGLNRDYWQDRKKKDWGHLDDLF